MKFTLIYDGELPAGHKKRAEYAAMIRNKLHVQMKDNLHAAALLARHRNSGTVGNKDALPELSGHLDQLNALQGQATHQQHTAVIQWRPDGYRSWLHARGMQELVDLRRGGVWG
jgi:hypothetical protein